MNELVFLQNQQALTTSLKVAEYFDKRHDRVLRAIEDAQSNLPKIGDVKKSFIKSTYKDAKGESRPMYLLTRDGFMFVVMGFTGKKAAELKWNYIQAFNAMEAALAERKSDRWQAVRGATKEGCKDLSAMIHELWEWAVSHGCKVPESKFHMNFYRLMNKTLGINPNSRDALALWQLNEIDKLQFIARTIIAGLLAQGADYHQPYQDCKLAFESYARLSFINQRLLEAGYGH